MAGWKVLFVLCFLSVTVVPGRGDCSDPPRSQYAEIEKDLDTFPVNTTLTYRCRPGYIWNPPSIKSITCQENSTWTDVKIICKPKSCGSLPDVLYGGVEFSSGTDFGSIATFHCDDGYNIVGRNQRVCLADGWDHQNPECTPVLCDAPPEIENGSFDLGTNRDIPVGTVVTYRCTSGELIGEARIHCNISGKWSNLPPSCKVVICQDPPFKNGRKTTNFNPPYNYRESVTFECNTGYRMTGPSTITCMEDNNWNPSPPSCEEIFCLSPEVPHGNITNISGEKFKYDTSVTFGCIEGYSMKGQDTVTCDGNGQWKPQLPTCEHADSRENGNNSHTTVLAVVGGVVAVVLLCGLIYGIYSWLTKKNEGSYHTTEGTQNPTQTTNANSQQYSVLQDKEAKY